jgi:hypothetical protein
MGRAKQWLNLIAFSKFKEECSVCKHHMALVLVQFNKLEEVKSIYAAVMLL